MSKVYFNQQTLKGKHELGNFDFIPAMGLDVGLNKVDNLTKGFVANHITAPPIMNRAIQNPMAFKAMGCKDEPQTHIIVRRPMLPSTMGLYPSTGVFRNTRKGLASDILKPNNGPLMPYASSFYGGMNNTLGIPV